MLNDILARLREPSSWAGLAVLLGSLGMSIPAELAQPIGLIGAGIAGLVAFFLPERGRG